MSKYIFDFDDVLFYNTNKFKKHMYGCFEDIGILYSTVKEYYQKERNKGFVLDNLVISVINGENVKSITSQELTERIMGQCHFFTNRELLNQIENLNINDCYIVTHGVTEYQLDKINRTGIKSLFCDIKVVQDTKKYYVEALCDKFRNETVVFVDDKESRFADLDLNKYPNLKTVLYTGPECINIIFSMTKKE